MHDSNETDQLLCYHPVSNGTGVAPAPVMVVVVIVGCQLQVVNVRNTLLGCLQSSKNVSSFWPGYVPLLGLIQELNNVMKISLLITHMAEKAQHSDAALYPPQKLVIKSEFGSQ